MLRHRALFSPKNHAAKHLKPKRFGYICRYMNFDQIVEYQKNAEEGKKAASVQIDEVRA